MRRQWTVIDGQPARLRIERIDMSTPFRRGALAVFAACFAIAASMAQAQGPHGHHGHRGKHGMDVERIIAQVKERLALDTSQQVLWENARSATKAAREAGRAERERLHAAARAELAKAEPDLAALAAAMDQAQAAGQAVRQQVRGEWLKLYATFSAAQKQVVRDELGKRLERMETFRAKMKERFGNRG
jgi:protein CpxP